MVRPREKNSPASAVKRRKKIEDYLPDGRPTMYRPEFCTQLLEMCNIEPYREITRENQKTGTTYTELVPNPLPSLAKFAIQVGVAHFTLWNWAKAHPEFESAIARAKTMIEHILVTNALAGLTDPRFAMFVAKNYTDLRDIKEVATVTPPDRATTPEEVQKRIDDFEKRIERLRAQL